MTSDARKCERRMGVAIIRFSSLRDRDATMPNPSPHMPEPMMFMPSRPGTIQSM